MKLPKTRSVLGRGLVAVRRWPKFVPSGRARVVSLVLGVLVFAGAATQVAVGWVTALPGNAVLRAGDTVVTEEEFQRRVDVLEALYGVKPPEEGRKLAKFDKDAAKSLAVSLVLDRAAQDRNVVVADKKARDALDKMIEEQLPGGRDDFVEFLSSQGVSERDVLDEVKRQLTTGKLFEHVTADVQVVTDEEVRQEFEDRKKEMVSPEKRHLRNIVVDSEQKAKRVLKQAQAGADFTKLAAKHSLDRSTKDKGGDLGTMVADQLEKDFAKAAFETDEGTYFGPVKSRHGWNVGQVVEIISSKQLSFDEVKKRLEQQMNTKRKLEAWRSWLAVQIKNAEIEYADSYRPDNPDAPPKGTPGK